MVLDMDRKITKRSFQRHQSHLQTPSGSSGIAGTSQSPEYFFGAAFLFWPIGPCIELESNYDASLGFCMTLAPLNISRRQGIARVLLRFRVNTLSPFKSVCETPINRFQYIRSSRECCLLVLACVLVAPASIRSRSPGVVIAGVSCIAGRFRFITSRSSTLNDLSEDRTAPFALSRVLHQVLPESLLRVDQGSLLLLLLGGALPAPFLHRPCRTCASTLVTRMG